MRLQLLRRRLLRLRRLNLLIHQQLPAGPKRLSSPRVTARTRSRDRGRRRHGTAATHGLIIAVTVRRWRHRGGVVVAWAQWAQWRAGDSWRQPGQLDIERLVEDRSRWLIRRSAGIEPGRGLVAAAAGAIWRRRSGSCPKLLEPACVGIEPSLPLTLVPVRLDGRPTWHQSARSDSHDQILSTIVMKTFRVGSSSQKRETAGTEVN